MTEQPSTHARIRRSLGKAIYASRGIFLETPSSDSPQTQALVPRGILPVSFRSKGTEAQRDPAARSHQAVVRQNQDSRPRLWTLDVGSSQDHETCGRHMGRTEAALRRTLPPPGLTSPPGAQPAACFDHCNDFRVWCPVPVICGDVQESWCATLLSQSVARSLGHRASLLGPGVSCSLDTRPLSAVTQTRSLLWPLTHLSAAPRNAG